MDKVIDHDIETWFQALETQHIDRTSRDLLSNENQQQYKLLRCVTDPSEFGVSRDAICLLLYECTSAEAKRSQDTRHRAHCIETSSPDYQVFTHIRKKYGIVPWITRYRGEGYAFVFGFTNRVFAVISQETYSPFLKRYQKAVSNFLLSPDEQAEAALGVQKITTLCKYLRERNTPELAECGGMQMSAIGEIGIGEMLFVSDAYDTSSLDLFFRQDCVYFHSEELFVSPESEEMDRLSKAYAFALKIRDTAEGFGLAISAFVKFQQCDETQLLIYSESPTQSESLMSSFSPRSISHSPELSSSPQQREPSLWQSLFGLGRDSDSEEDEAIHSVRDSICAQCEKSYDDHCGVFVIGIYVPFFGNAPSS